MRRTMTDGVPGGDDMQSLGSDVEFDSVSADL